MRNLNIDGSIRRLTPVTAAFATFSLHCCHSKTRSLLSPFLRAKGRREGRKEGNKGVIHCQHLSGRPLKVHANVLKFSLFFILVISKPSLKKDMLKIVNLKRSAIILNKYPNNVLLIINNFN